MPETVLHLVVAARPNFMKVAPLYHALKRESWCRPILVHTGQHYDANMSAVFLADLGLPCPDIALGAGSGSHAVQTAAVMVAYEQECLRSRPDAVLVVGDVNSTMACAITARKLHLPVIHLEAGLRNGDRRLPEEINRVVTDTISDLLLTPSADADAHLLAEGIDPWRIVRVGNIMIDSYVMLREKICRRAADWPCLLSLPGPYGVVTLHRPENVDALESLQATLAALAATARSLPLVFPVHPRTRKSLEAHGLWAALCALPGLILQEPLAYVDFMALVQGARLVITDSGGIQEETTFLGIPCLTLRENTERPITITQGTNRLTSMTSLGAAVKTVLDTRGTAPQCPPLWDGHTAERTVAVLKQFAAGGCRADEAVVAAAPYPRPAAPSPPAGSDSAAL